MILSGKQVADSLLEEMKRELKKEPTLVVIQVGENPASSTYIRMKRKACDYVGIRSVHLEFAEDVKESHLLSEIKRLNDDPKVSGILVQLPLPAHLTHVLDTIDPAKDVDGFHPINMGKLLLGLKGFVPCTPLGIHTLLKRSQISVEGKRVVIVGRSHIVGMPLAALWMQKRAGCNATVTVAHSCTPKLEEVTASADILVAAMGKPKFIKEHMVKEGAVVIDVGINRIDKKLVGDVDFEQVQHKCSTITPVPGGVGPMTVAMLLHNTIEACA
ncbi:MAG: bifunctional 5,10-methylene-tetrahydrofolate dehydrogenase/5,10-methylene-tetrahydrofolate cyclohydrolase [Chlamydiales bacterium]|nr:bifunctional 5,10-methylene-tetrahydrofolate dehydrogenase/5,10-methylene-tetrahydrofolate cyclohydrolase [Chlamydiales bacterium]